jgi:hypothetical protein
MEDKIIVLRYFDSTIDANIAKTKLDAYGVPCFLTEENISNLYPGQAFTGRVRLHLFSRDEHRAREILADVQLTSDADSMLRCDRCNSSRVVRDFPKAFRDTLTVLFLGVFLQRKKVNCCLDCGNEF